MLKVILVLIPFQQVADLLRSADCLESDFFDHKVSWQLGSFRSTHSIDITPSQGLGAFHSNGSTYRGKNKDELLKTDQQWEFIELEFWFLHISVWEGGTLLNKNWKYNKLPILYFLTQGTLWKTNQTFCPVYHTIIWQLNQSPGQVTVSWD